MRRVLQAVALAILAAPPTLASATILTFDQERDAATQSTVQPTSSGGALPADYGNGVTGAVMAVPGGSFTYGDGGEGFTPDVTVDILAGSTTDARVSLWQSGYGDLVNVIFADGPGTAGAPLLSVRFTAALGFAVDLYGFDLAGFGLDYVIAGVSVLAGATTLFSETDVLVQGDASGPPRTSFAFGTPLSASELLLLVDLSNLAPGIQDNVGMDNIRFGQMPTGEIDPDPDNQVPEPGTLVLLGLAICASGLTRKTLAGKRAV